MTAQEVNLQRRSVNFFDKNKPVDMDLVRRVLKEAAFTPSSRNLQPWRVILVKEEESKEKLYNLAYKQQKVLDAPITLLLVGDFEAYDEHNSAWDERREKTSNEEVSEIINKIRKSYQNNEKAKHKLAYLNTGLFAMNLMNLFKAYGMDTHPIGGFKAKEVHEAFNLKEYEEAVMLLSVGYHDDEVKLIPRLQRKNYKQLVEEV